MSTSSQQPPPCTFHNPQPRKAMHCFHRDHMVKQTLQFQLGLLNASEPFAGYMQQGGHRKKFVIGPLLSPVSHVISYPSDIRSPLPSTPAPLSFLLPSILSLSLPPLFYGT